jgi:hypothetical protein
VFLSVLEAQVRLGLWRRYYNEERLHSRLDYQTPAEFASKWAGQERKDRVQTKALVDLTTDSPAGLVTLTIRVREGTCSLAG